MNAVVLCGSPKKEFSTSKEFARFLERKFDTIAFSFYEISSRIKEIEEKNELFEEIMTAVSKSDIVIWAFPVYTYLVPAQYKKFIEMIFERGMESKFSGKYSCVLATSIHLYDNTAVKYMDAISKSLGMSYFDYFSAQNMQLAFFNNQYRIIHFFQNFIRAYENKVVCYKNIAEKDDAVEKIEPVVPTNKIDNTGTKILILTDGYTKGTKILIDAFQGSLKVPADIIDLNNIDIKGGVFGVYPVYI